MSTDEAEIRAIYRDMLSAWNRRDAAGFARCFSDTGSSIGFDGSAANGQAEIEAHLAPIFRDHETPVYVEKLRELRMVGADVALLRAVAGMVPAGAKDLNPALNTVQSLIVAKHDGRWRIALLQNTPAAYHGRPQAAEELTAELREIWRQRSGAKT
jgi:uncharacterized protein (TIGR02246 family)